MMEDGSTVQLAMLDLDRCVAGAARGGGAAGSARRESRSPVQRERGESVTRARRREEAA
jgi:hypothetical protein